MTSNNKKCMYNLARYIKEAFDLRNTLIAS